MRIQALIKRIIRQMLRDKRTLALLFFAPLIVLTLMYFFFNGNGNDPVIGVVGADERLAALLEEREIQFERFEAADPQTVIEEELDGLLAVENGSLKLTLLNDDPSVARSILVQINQALLMQNPAVGGNALALETEYIYGSEDTEFFDVLSPVLIGFFVFFFVFLISGIGLLKERTSGTLERLMATPIRRWELVAAYLAGYGLFAIIQTVIVVSFSVLVLDVVLVGSIWHVILTNLLLALVALSLGTLLSSFASSEFQMVQFIPVVVIPQIFFAGIFPVDGMVDWLQGIGRIMPIYYAADALKSVMYKGQGLADISGDLLALGVFAIVFIGLNIVALKKHRKL
ncbi:Inner membrane transport permease YbhR [Planococcus massiliensis]|uniref:Inner membrane transport permease YbhR n=1 Tax=Planococcus massiliensis TaxID=1499687 RepID=A0A098ENP3_9BACL|nr:ABC transporter permease [Planococcus massiliensis]CEG23904.1 Inner membrane transport permease YbhR [Planococcus massiliensis]